MIKIEHISVKNYKNIREADLPLTDFNVIVGPNNSGKSNFLGVLGFLNFIVNGTSNNLAELLTGKKHELIGEIFPLNSDFMPLSIFLEFLNTETKIEYSYSLKIALDKQTKSNLPYRIEEEIFAYKNINKTGMQRIIFRRDGINIKFTFENSVF